MIPRAFMPTPCWGFTRTAKTSTYAVTAVDRGYTIDCTSGTFSVTLAAAATLGSGFSFGVYNSGSGVITIDPNGSETIRGPEGSATTLTLSQGNGVLIMCDGAGFDVVANSGLAVSLTTTQTISGAKTFSSPVIVEAGRISMPLSPGGTYVGYQVASNSPANSTYNTLFGYQCGTLLGSTNTGYNNAIGGFQSGQALTTGYSNSVWGFQGLYSCNVGAYNEAFGIHALYAVTSGGNNCAFGTGAMQVGNVSNSVAVGTYAGRDCLGSGNVFIGYNAGMTETGSNKLYIANASGTPLILGDFSAQTVAVTGSFSASGNVTAGVAQIINNIAGSSRDFAWQTSASDRWRLRGSGEAESGSNAGTNLYLNAYTDAGAYIDSPFNCTRAAGGAFAFARPVTNTSSILSTSPTLGVGYATGAGGTVSQSTSKSTGVTLSKVCGTITMNGAALAADTSVSFTLTNTAIAATDYVAVQHDSVGTLGAYNCTVTPAAGSASVTVRNLTPGSLSEAIVLRFVVIKAATT